MASSDLGGLGAKEGTPVSYNWTPPNPIFLLLPWLAVLLLLLVKPNRCAQSWWIWLPLVVVAVLERMPVFHFLPSSLIDMFVEVISALAFGIAAVWLLAPYLARRHRFVTFLCILSTMAGFSVLVFVIGQDWRGGEVITAAQVSIMLGLGIFVASVAIALAGWACRGRYRPLRLSLWLIAALLAVCLIVTAPFSVIEIIMSNGQVPWLKFLSVVLTMVGIMAGVVFAILLPFLVLSFANAFFRERLKVLLHMERKPLPPLITQPPTANPAT